MTARNNVARFRTAAKDVHAEFMAGYIERGRAGRRLVTLRSRAAFASQSGSSYVCLLDGTIQITTMVESLHHASGPLDLTRTFIGGGFEPLPGESDALATPSARLEARLGFEGLSQSYDLVLDHRAASSIKNAAVLTEHGGVGQGLYNELSETYPELPQVRNAKAAACVVLMCGQKLNVSDIEFWLYGRPDAEYQEYTEHVRRLIGGHHLGWVPSASTLRRIEIAAASKFMANLH